ncbi:unnamed protein product [Didymodactylos carnosus]|nr:unnamed protein product [Didymodactylos carnosus]CAF4282304.1 unnamed protein product [Didymodactylos carnosus]
MADKLGRKRMYGVELIIIIIATLASAMTGDTKRGIGIIPLLAFWRLILGFGIGGDYPTSAVITSEFATSNRRGLMIAAVFAMQGIGILLGATVALLTILFFKSSIENDPFMLDYVWRIIIGVGCIPALGALYFRITLPESPRYTADVEGNHEEAIRNIKNIMEKTKEKVQPRYQNQQKRTPNTWKNFRVHFGKLKHFKVLFGCSVCWFLLDIAFYGLTLNQSMVLDVVVNKIKKSPYETTWDQVKGNLIIAFLGSVPGYWFTVFLVEKMGRIKIQLMGFGLLTIIFITLSVAYHQITSRPALFLIIYGAGQFFFNFGPNATTFILPAEVFPTRWRSTCHGLAAASGKLGAIIASASFPSIAGDKNENLRPLIGSLSIIMALGFCFTFLIPEPCGRTLEEISADYDDGDDSNEEGVSDIREEQNIPVTERIRMNNSSFIIEQS